MGNASNMSQLRPLVLLCLAIVASSAPMITTTVNYGEGCHGAIDPDLYCYTGRNKTDCEGDQGETDCLWVHERNPLGPESSCHCSTPWWECYVKETKSECQQNPADGCSWVFGGLSSEGLFYCNYTDSSTMEQQQPSPISHPSSSLMPRVNLSEHGPEVSRIALGILHLAQDPKVTSVKDARAVLEAARAAGITTFDLADNYAAGKCLELFGAALQSLEEDHPGWRAGIQVIAKIGELDNGDYAPGGPLPWLDTSMAYTQNITEYYLRVMGTSYLDLLIYHWPDRLTHTKWPQPSGRSRTVARSDSSEYRTSSHCSSSSFQLRRRKSESRWSLMRWHTHRGLRKQRMTAQWKMRCFEESGLWRGGHLAAILEEERTFCSR